jgi:Ser/Thr protein kinase RdoA (MazF antagonist)
LKEGIDAHDMNLGGTGVVLVEREKPSHISLEDRDEGRELWECCEVGGVGMRVTEPVRETSERRCACFEVVGFERSDHPWSLTPSVARSWSGAWRVLIVLSRRARKSDTPTRALAPDFAGVSLPQRATVTPDLLRVLHAHYGLRPEDEPVDLGGSNNLNLHLPHADGGLVVRVYCPWTSPARLRAIQLARLALVSVGLPFADTVATVDGQTWVAFDGRVIEVERYVAGENMDIGAGLLHGMRVLGQIHDVLAGIDPPSAATTAPFPNHVEADQAFAWTRDGTATIRSGNPSADELRTAAVADTLAAELAGPELAIQSRLPRQLVHGDFWDNNVLFRNGEIVLVLDLDFMGERARIDDLALTLYYANSTLGAGYNSPERIATLRELVDSYDGGLTVKLSATERAALPYALARTVLCFVGMLAFIQEAGSRSKLILEITPDLDWSLDLVRNVERWQTAFAEHGLGLQP